MKNWKTTVGGFLFAGGTLAGHVLPPQYQVFGLAAQAAAGLWMGCHAQDAAK